MYWKTSKKIHPNKVDHAWGYEYSIFEHQVYVISKLIYKYYTNLNKTPTSFNEHLLILKSLCDGKGSRSASNLKEKE